MPAEPTTLDDLVVNFLAEPSDLDGDAVSYVYAWYQDGTSREDLTTPTVPAVETTRDEEWRVVVTPNDGAADGDPVEASVTIVDSPPITTVEIAPEAPLTTDALVATASASDADDDPITLTYAWTRDGVATTDTASTIPAGTAKHGETWAVTVSPGSVGEPATDAVLVENTPPALASVSLSPSPATEESLVEATVDGIEDADADSVTLRYDWYVDGVLVRSDDDETLTGALFDKHQLVSVVVTPNDGFVDGAAVSSDELLIDNTAPTGTSATITPAEVFEATTVSCVPTGFDDVDGDAESWRYDWQVNGTSVATTATIDGSLFNRDDTLGCTPVPTDGELDGAAVIADTVVVQDTPPTLADVVLSTTSPSASDTLLAILGVASDEDGDPISYAYQWFVDGAAVSTDAELSPAFFSKGQSIYVVVTPSDGTLDGTPVSSLTATSINSAPTGATVSISPTTAYTNDTLTASAAASDADGDTVTFSFAWYVDGTLRGTDTTLAGATEFDRGQVVYVVATPSDGETAGAAATSSTLTILNSPPTAPAVSISPSVPVSGDDLVCSITSAATDADGDALSYSFTWERDGAVYTATKTTTYAGDTVDGADVVEPHSWTCTVTASDGIESGAPGSATETGPSPTDGGTGAFCGDGTCDADESCWSCDADCGSCDCPTDAEVILYTPSAWTVLADALEADPSNCADYYLTLPANSGDKTTPRSGDEPEGIRARGSHFHAVAEFHWTTWSSESGSWYDKGVAFREAMEDAGYNVDGGDTWAINELPSTVRSDPSVRDDALEAVRGLYDGPSGATPTQGIVYVVGMGQGTTNFSVYKPYVEDWLTDASFWSSANLYVRFWAQEVYADPTYTCVPGETTANVSSNLNSYVEHFARHAETGASDANTAQSYLGRAYVPLMNAVWYSDGAYGDTMVDLDTMKSFVSHQVYAARSWSNDHNYPDGRLGFAWDRSDGVDDTDLAELAARLASAIHYAYDEGGGSAAGACSPSGAYTWCGCEVTGAAFNTGWDTFESW